MARPAPFSGRPAPISLRTLACRADADQAHFHDGIVQRSHRSTLFGHLASRPCWVCSRSPNPLHVQT